MKIKVVTNGMTIKVSGKHSAKKMKRIVIDLLDSLPAQEEEEEMPFGFAVTAHVERAPEKEFEYDEDYWEDTR